MNYKVKGYIGMVFLIFIISWGSYMIYSIIAKTPLDTARLLQVGIWAQQYPSVGNEVKLCLQKNEVITTLCYKRIERIYQQTIAKNMAKSLQE